MNYGRDGLNLDDEDRLPWLEPAEAEDDDLSAGAPAWKVLALVLGGLAALGLIVGAIYWVQSRVSGAPADTKLIAAPDGSYKVPAGEVEGRTFKGEGDLSHATSAGVESASKIDAAKVPETPMVDVSRGSVTAADSAAADRKAAAAAPAVSATIKPATAGPATAAPAKAAATGPMIQLGAYGSESIARDAWAKLGKRFDYLKPLTMSIQPTQTANGTLYRLRASAGTPSNAATLCGRLKVAGENCIVVN